MCVERNSRKERERKEGRKKNTFVKKEKEEREEMRKKTNELNPSNGWRIDR